ncbi:MAG: DUF488 domain-containing protein [Chloroflexi bacterium]|nr:DUF488 domain-containing protein [Chloroflexota bacterium]
MGHPPTATQAKKIGGSVSGELQIYALGHSTRPLDELIALLDRYGITTLADVRTIPRSRRNPQFNREALAAVLTGRGITYVHLARLGGLRRGLGAASPNTAWRNASFRGYADYMLTPEFAEGLDELLKLAARGPIAIMCAEAVPWRCHRSLIADALLVRGITVQHIQDLRRCTPHRLTPFARVDGERVTYPDPATDPPAPAPDASPR